MPKRHPVLSVFAIIIMFAVSLFAAKFWEKKVDYSTWTKEECEELLESSPWVQVYTNVNWGPGGENLSGERQEMSLLYFKLLSAKPIRMALGQTQVLANPNVAGIQEKVKTYVNQARPNQIVFQISYSTRPPGASILRDWDTFFRNASLADFKDTVYLTGSTAGNVRISEYRRPDANNPLPQFVFPRSNEAGVPYFNGTEKTISLRAELNVQLKGKRERIPVVVKFDTKKMVFNNEFEF